MSTRSFPSGELTGLESLLVLIILGSLFGSTICFALVFIWPLLMLSPLKYIGAAMAIICQLSLFMFMWKTR